MENTAIESRLSKTPAGTLSSITLGIVIVLLFLLEDPDGKTMSTLQIIGYTICFIFIILSCFVICRAHPESVKSTPIICNLVGILGIIMYIFTDFSTFSEFAFWGSCLVLSAIAAILGASVGRRKLEEAK